MLGILDLITITGVFDYIFVKNEIFPKLVVIMRMKGIGTMVYFTGDIHGDVFPIIEFYNRFLSKMQKNNAEITWKNPVFLGVFWRPWRDLNLRPFAYEHKKIPSKKLEF